MLNALFFMFQIYSFRPNDPFNNNTANQLDEFEIFAAAYIIERPGIEAQRSRKRLFFHRKISNSLNLNNIAILERKINYFCLRSNFRGWTTLNHQTLRSHLFTEIFIQKMLPIIKIFKPFIFETFISCWIISSYKIFSE